MVLSRRPNRWHRRMSPLSAGVLSSWAPCIAWSWHGREEWHEHFASYATMHTTRRGGGEESPAH